MIISIHSYVSPEAQLLIADHAAFNQATVESCSVILNNAIDQIREEFSGRVDDALVFHRLASRVTRLAQHVQAELQSLWHEEDNLLAVRPECYFEGTSTLRIEVLPRFATPLSTSLH